MRRKLAFISLLYVLIIAFCAYSPWDFLGVYSKANSVDMYLSDGVPVSASGKVHRKEIKNNSFIYYVEDATVTCENGRFTNISFIFKLDSNFIPNYSKVNIEGVAACFNEARNEGGFDMKSYYQSLGYYFEVKEVKVNEVTSIGLNIFDGFYQVNNSILSVYKGCLPGEEAGLLASITLGNKSDLEDNVKSLFQLVGLAHILAVSGLHVSVVCMGFYKFLRKRGICFLVAGILSAIIAFFYGALTGWSLSSIRAIGMFFIFLLADITGRAYDSITALAVLAAFLLFMNPLYIKNGSFILSFSAILGIIYIAKPLGENYSLYCNKRRNLQKHDDCFIKTKKTVWAITSEYFGSGIVFSIGVSIAMLPLVTYMYYQQPLYSIFLNIILLPLIPMLLGIGLIGGFVGLISINAGSAILFFCHLIMYFIEGLAFQISKLPLSTVIIGRHGLPKILMYYAAVLVVLYCKRFQVVFGDNQNPRRQLHQAKRRMLVKFAMILMLEVVWCIPEKQGFEIDVLDVGQGDGIYITSSDGVRFFIDGGSTSSDAVGKFTIMPFLKYKGAGTIDYWFLSHMDLDHVSGVLELLDSGYHIKNIVLSKEIPDDDTLRKLLSLAKANGTKVLYMSEGDVLKTKHLAFRCVYPFKGATSDDINALSLSLLMEYDANCDNASDYSAFFGGDIAAEQEQAIARSGTVGHVDFLKVSHHGSRFSSDEEFLSVLSPDVAVVSCAKVNRYGHPAAEAVERLEAAAENVYYTMDSGRVRARVGEVDVFIW